jgi:predicted outer membrane lipoprotein
MKRLTQDFGKLNTFWYEMTDTRLWQTQCMLIQWNDWHKTLANSIHFDSLKWLTQDFGRLNTFWDNGTEWLTQDFGRLNTFWYNEMTDTRLWQAQYILIQWNDWPKTLAGSILFDMTDPRLWQTHTMKWLTQDFGKLNTFWFTEMTDPRLWHEMIFLLITSNCWTRTALPISLLHRKNGVPCIWMTLPSGLNEWQPEILVWLSYYSSILASERVWSGPRLVEIGGHSIHVHILSFLIYFKTFSVCWTCAPISIGFAKCHIKCLDAMLDFGSHRCPGFLPEMNLRG